MRNEGRTHTYRGQEAKTIYSYKGRKKRKTDTTHKSDKQKIKNKATHAGNRS